MFFVKKGEDKKPVKASNLNDLIVKANKAWNMNPNTSVLYFCDPEDGEFEVHNEEAYEYMESRIEELKAEKASYKGLIEIREGAAKQPAR